MDTAAITQLVTDLDAVATLNVATELEALNVPGVWVRVTGHTADRLRGGTWQLQLVCVAPDLGADRALAQLSATYNLLTSVVDPFGDVTVVGVPMPDGPTLSGLSVPFTLPYDESE